jgi:hypothetical protein
VLQFLSERARLRTVAGGRLFLYIEHTYVVVGDEWGTARVRTLNYIYAVFDAGQQRLFGWHYHPEGRAEQPVLHPHLHVYIDAPAAGQRLPRLHLPTSRVAVEDVVTFLVEGLGAAPRAQYAALTRGEPRWRGLLRESRQSFVRERSWA